MLHITDTSLLEKKIGYLFKNKGLLEQALTHSSYANERKINKTENYERLEFLGDAVLELISSEFLFFKNPDMAEGMLTKTRAGLVCEPALAYCARKLGLEEFIRLGKGEDITGGRDRDSIISDVCEAVIGAIYLDGGFKAAKDFIEEFVLSGSEDMALFNDSKTLLQEIIQAREFKSFEYELINESGPDHAKVFEVEAVLDGKTVGYGKGRTKKSAEQQAAFEAIKLLKKDTL